MNFYAWNAVRYRTLGIICMKGKPLNTLSFQCRILCSILCSMLLLVVGGTIACATQPAPPVGKPASLDAAAARLSKLAGKRARPFATRDYCRYKNSAARSVLVASGRAEGLIQALRAELPPGLITFIGCTNLVDRASDDRVEIVVAKGSNQFDILRVAQSNAANHGMATEDLIKKLQEYDKKYGIDIFRAETDSIEFNLRTLPKDMKRFCEDLYKLCPNIVDQDAETIAALETEIRNTKSVFLWWN